MAELAFAQPSRRNYLPPITLALLVIGAAVYCIIHYTPHKTAVLSIPQLSTWQTRTVFKNETIQVANDTSQDDLYVLTTLRVEDQLRLPLFVKDLTASLVTAQGETLTTSAIEKADLAQLLIAYPELKKRTALPLYRDTEIAPGASTQGMVLLHFPIAEPVWKHRQSAALTVNFYHQPPQTIALP